MLSLYSAQYQKLRSKSLLQWNDVSCTRESTWLNASQDTYLSYLQQLHNSYSSKYGHRHLQDYVTVEHVRPWSEGIYTTTQQYYNICRFMSGIWSYHLLSVHSCLLNSEVHIVTTSVTNMSYHSKGRADLVKHWALHFCAETLQNMMQFSGMLLWYLFILVKALSDPLDYPRFPLFG